MPRPRGGKWLAEDLQHLRDAEVEVLVSLLPETEAEELELSQEAELCRLNGIKFVWFPISDFDMPGSFAEAQLQIAHISGFLAQGKNVVIHCRGGVGRSGMIAASVLSMRGISPEDAFSLIAAARGCAVPETAEQRNWVLALFLRRP